MASVMYDVLNRIAVDSVLSTAKAYELYLIKHLEYSKENDLLLYDRNYPSYFHLATLCFQKKKFVIRCSASSFKPARNLLKGEGDDSKIVTLKPHQSKLKQIKAHNLLEEITVRFVRVKLETGEYEVLVTNLLDEIEFPSEYFLDIYHLPWGVEGFYAILKTRI